MANRGNVDDEDRVKGRRRFSRDSVVGSKVCFSMTSVGRICTKRWIGHQASTDSRS